MSLKTIAEPAIRDTSRSKSLNGTSSNKVLKAGAVPELILFTKPLTGIYRKKGGELRNDGLACTGLSRYQHVYFLNVALHILTLNVTTRT